MGKEDLSIHRFFMNDNSPTHKLFTVGNGNLPLPSLLSIASHCFFPSFSKYLSENDFSHLKNIDYVNLIGSMRS